MLKKCLGRLFFSSRLLVLFFVGFCCTNALANTVLVKFSSTYTLPPNVTEVKPALRFCSPKQIFSHLVLSSPLASSGTMSQQVFLPSNTNFVSPGVEFRDSAGTTHYAYCAEQVPYSLRFHTLSVVLRSIQTNPYAVTCRIRVAGVKS